MFIHGYDGKGVFGTRPGGEGGGTAGEPRDFKLPAEAFEADESESSPPRSFIRGGGETCIWKKVGGTLETV